MMGPDRVWSKYAGYLFQKRQKFLLSAISTHGNGGMVKSAITDFVG